jgi:hypothetical protein
MEVGIDKNSKDSKSSNQNLFSGNDDPRSSSRAGGAVLSSQEDQEAMPADQDNSLNNVLQQPTNTSKENGYMKEKRKSENGSKVAEKEIGEHVKQEERKNSDSKTEQRDSQHGASGMPFDAGSLTSPHSSSKNKINNKEFNDSREKNNTEKSLNSKHDSKDDLGWNEDSKNNVNNEDEKQAEERSLLYPENEANIYKDVLKDRSEDDKDMRRSSTKPERPNASRDQSRNSAENKEKEEEEEDKPIMITE